MGSVDPVVDTGDGRAAPAGPARDLVPFGEALRTWFAISLQTFGGPAGQIAVMQRVLVEERRWIGQQRFLHALSYCTLLPGPEAQQLAVYTGWLLNGTRGGLAAGTLFVLPGVLALLVLSAVYVGLGETAAVAAVFAGLAPAVLAVVAHAVVRIGRRALDHAALRALAVVAFVALAGLAVPFPVVVAVAGGPAGRWAASRRRSWPAAGAPPPGRTDRSRWSPTPRCTPSAPPGGGPCGCWRSGWRCGAPRSRRWHC